MTTTSDQQFQDLSVAIIHCSLVVPSATTNRYITFLSNIDQALNFDVQTVHFFLANPHFPIHEVTEKMRMALGKLLVPYDFMAGRLKRNLQLGRLEIDGNAAGAGFVVASAEIELEKIGDLARPNPGFRRLIATSSENMASDDQPLCVFQLTSFRCGGFSIGLSTNHTALDGVGVKTFLDNLAALLHGNPMPFAPFRDRTLLAARSPPQVTFSHPELLQLNAASAKRTLFELTSIEDEFKVFNIGSKAISDFKQLAAKTGSGRKNIVSTFNVLAAVLWRCWVLATHHHEANEESTMLYAMDIRSRLRPPLPAEYAGNAVLSAYAKARLAELRNEALGTTVERVADGAARMTDEYIRSVIDWGEMSRGFPSGDVLISSWWRMGFDAVKYPWGRPTYSCPVLHNRKDVVLLLPAAGDSDAVNVLVPLPREQLQKFEDIFVKFLREFANPL